MEDSKAKSSPILAYLEESLAEALPAEEQSKLAEFHDDIATATSAGDAKRARHCAHWALQNAGDPNDFGIHKGADELRAAYKLLKDSLFGVEFGLETDLGSTGWDSTGVGYDVQIQWVNNSVDVAKALAEETGWQEVPWQSLIRELLAIS